MLAPFYPEPVTITDCILDAPPSRDLYLPVKPVRSITSVYYRSDAGGLLANFTADYLLDNAAGDQYQLLVDDPITGWSRQGCLRRIDMAWGYTNIVPLSRLASQIEPERGSIKVTYTAGPSALPPEIEAAAVLAVSILLARKKTGMPVVSESWNGYSASYAGPFTATGVLYTPDIQAMLSPYLPQLRIG